jgi:hypothetical protein
LLNCRFCRLSYAAVEFESDSQSADLAVLEMPPTTIMPCGTPSFQPFLQQLIAGIAAGIAAVHKQSFCSVSEAGEHITASHTCPELASVAAAAATATTSQPCTGFVDSAKHLRPCLARNSAKQPINTRQQTQPANFEFGVSSNLQQPAMQLQHLSHSSTSNHQNAGYLPNEQAFAGKDADRQQQQQQQAADLSLHSNTACNQSFKVPARLPGSMQKIQKEQQRRHPLQQHHQLHKASKHGVFPASSSCAVTSSTALADNMVLMAKPAAAHHQQQPQAQIHLQESTQVAQKLLHSQAEPTKPTACPSSTPACRPAVILGHTSGGTATTAAEGASLRSADAIQSPNATDSVKINNVRRCILALEQELGNVHPQVSVLADLCIMLLCHSLATESQIQQGNGCKQFNEHVCIGQGQYKSLIKSDQSCRKCFVCMTRWVMGTCCWQKSCSRKGAAGH